MATKQNKFDTPSSFKKKKIIKQNNIVFIIQTDLPQNIHNLTAYQFQLRVKTHWH